MKEQPRRGKYFRSRSPVHELLSPKGGSTGAERPAEDKRWRIQMMIEYTPIPETGEHEADHETKVGPAGAPPSVVGRGGEGRRGEGSRLGGEWFAATSGGHQAALVFRASLESWWS